MRSPSQTLGHHLLCDKDRCRVLYYYHFPIINHFRNWDHISFPFLLLCLLEDNIFKALRKHEEGKIFYLIHHGLMNKLYIYHLSQNPSLLVNPLASITPQVFLDPGPSPSHKKFKKTFAPKVEIYLEVKISLIESNSNTTKGM